MTTLKEDHNDDAVNVAPNLHTVIYEDDKMRVLKVSVKPGETADMHWHPHNINCVLSPGTLQFARRDGSETDIPLKKDQVTFSVVDNYHAVKNVGDSTVETIQVELKY